MSDLILPIINLDKRPCRALFTSCIILTRAKQILLQKRGCDWHSFPGYICTFGGEIEPNETPDQGLKRELQAEIGAVVHDSELVFLQAYTEKATHYQDIIYGYFWHDSHDKITGCYEGEALYLSSINDVLQTNCLMDDVRWLLMLCQQKKLLS